MNIQLKNPSYWRLLFALAITLLLFTAIFLRNPTVMTYNKIKLKEPCIYLPKENTEISLEKLFKHKEVFVDLSRQGVYSPAQYLPVL